MRIEIVGKPGTDRDVLLTLVNYMLREVRLPHKVPEFPITLFPGVDKLRDRLTDEQTHIDVVVREDEDARGNPATAEAQTVQ